MIGGESMQEMVKTLRRLAQEERYDEALALIEEMGKTMDLPPDVLVLKGIDIQMASEDSGYQLKDAEEAFGKALSIDEKYVEALLELGWLFYAACDKAREAKGLFEMAFAISRSQMTEAVLGIAKCLHDAEGKVMATKFLDEVGSGSLDWEQIDNLKREIEEHAQ